MLTRKPALQIQHIDKIEITTPYHPFWEEVMIEHLKQLRTEAEREKRILLDSPQRSEPHDLQPSGGPRILDLLSKTVSILSGLAVIVFVALMLAGKTTIGAVQVGTLLTVVSFTLVGGLVSIGGVKMFSINASLRRARDRIERVVRNAGGCPFVNVLDEQAIRDYDLSGPFNVGDNRFCQGCHLVDLRGRTVCKVHPDYRG